MTDAQEIVCLSLRQPWLWAMQYAHKSIENRARLIGLPAGRVHLHEALGCKPEEYESACAWMEALGLASRAHETDHPLGVVPRIPPLAELPRRSGLVGHIELSRVILAPERAQGAFDLVVHGKSSGSFESTSLRYDRRWHFETQHGYVLQQPGVTPIAFVATRGYPWVWRLPKKILEAS